MRYLRKVVRSKLFSCFLVLGMFCILTTSAWADLESGMSDLQSKILAISTPLAIIFLIIAAWQKAMGNDQLFYAALIGTVIMFAAPQIVEFVSAAFGV